MLIVNFASYYPRLILCDETDKTSRVWLEEAGKTELILKNGQKMSVQNLTTDDNQSFYLEKHDDNIILYGLSGTSLDLMKYKGSTLTPYVIKAWGKDFYMGKKIEVYFQDTRYRLERHYQYKPNPKQPSRWRFCFASDYNIIYLELNLVGYSPYQIYTGIILKEENIEVLI